MLEHLGRPGAPRRSTKAMLSWHVPQRGVGENTAASVTAGAVADKTRLKDGEAIGLGDGATVGVQVALPHAPGSAVGVCTPRTPGCNLNNWQPPIERLPTKKQTEIRQRSILVPRKR